MNDLYLLSSLSVEVKTKLSYFHNPVALKRYNIQELYLLPLCKAYNLYDR